MNWLRRLFCSKKQPTETLRERYDRLRKDVVPSNKEESIEEDAICTYLLISTRGPNWKEDYEKILKEETEKMLAKGWAVDADSRTTFWPPKKHENSGSNSQS